MKMKLFATALVLCAAACNPGGSSPKTPELKTPDDKSAYELGAMLGMRMKDLGLKPADVETAVAGFRDSALGNKLAADPQADMASLQKFVQEHAQAHEAVASADAKKKGTAFAEAKAKESGAEKLADGLIYIEQKAGTGETPKPTDTVKVNYEGKLPDGTVFDSSIKRGQPATFPLNGVIKCWTEGVGKMKVGGKAELVCPAEIAYGERGHPPAIPGGSTLDFTVELLSIEAPAAQASAVAAPPPASAPKKKK